MFETAKDTEIHFEIGRDLFLEGFPRSECEDESQTQGWDSAADEQEIADTIEGWG